MPGRYLIRITVSSVVLWGLMRGILTAGGAMVPQPIVSMAIVAIAVWLIRLDMRTMNEDVFLANLGVDRWRIWSAATVPALVLETAAAVVGRAMGLQ